MGSKEIVTNISNTIEFHSELEKIREELELLSVEALYDEALRFYLDVLTANRVGYDVVGQDEDGEILSIPEIVKQSSFLLGLPDEDEVPWNVLFIEHKRKKD